MLNQLAEIIKSKIKDNFEEIHLSGNLMNTIEIKRTVGGFSVEIPAKLYDIAFYKKEKVIKYTGLGSYAQLVNTSGGFSNVHINYVEKAIQESIQEWIKTYNLNVKEIKYD